MKVRVLLLLVVLSLSSYVQATPENEQVMTNQKLDTLLKRFDKDVMTERLGFWQLNYQGQLLYVVTDDKSNRMRIIMPITEASQLEKEHLQRLMQANFDTALDARYAIAQGNVWSAFIHSLGSLSERDFFSGLAQVITLAKTFGTTFSSGALSYSGGDSRGEQEKLYQQLLQQGLSV